MQHLIPRSIPAAAFVPLLTELGFDPPTVKKIEFGAGYLVAEVETPSRVGPATRTYACIPVEATA